jgi:catechol 2,3-dioxygenase-like lactoylglutathione lyase family enzyme
VPVRLDHTIVAAADAEASARWFSELFGLAPPAPLGHFWPVTTANGVSLDFDSVGDRPVTAQHYAFLVGEADFDAIFERIVERRLEHWADPGRSRPGQINRRDGGRGVYFASNDGHLLEIITRPYGGG